MLAPPSIPMRMGPLGDNEDEAAEGIVLLVNARVLSSAMLRDGDKIDKINRHPSVRESTSKTEAVGRPGAGGGNACFRTTAIRGS